MELNLGDPVVVLIENVVFSKFDDAVDVDDTILFCFELGNGFFINFFEFDFLFLVWRFSVFAFDVLTFSVDIGDVLFWCVACLLDCLDDDEVFSDVFELLAFVDTDGKSSDDSLSSDDGFDVVPLFFD